MKRFRVKAIGLGLALTAGSVLAADGDWRPLGAPNDPPPTVVPAGAPGLLPPSLRAHAPKDDGAIWLPARAPAPTVLQAGARESAPAVPPVGPVPLPLPPMEMPEPVGPRVGGVGPLPAIPELPDGPPLPPATAEPPVARAVPQVPAKQPDPPAKRPDAVPPPRPADPPKMVTPLTPPDLLPNGEGANPLSTPRPLDPRPADPRPVDLRPELPPAPSELMYPAGALDVPKHGVFGSPPIRLSRDYSSIHDLTSHGSHDTRITDEGAAGPMNRYFVRGEYLQWWLPGFATPVLGTTNGNTALNGYLGEPGTTALLGPGAFIDSARSGVRVRAGMWLNEEQSCGIDGGFFFLGKRSESAAFGSDRFPLITRPIFAPNLVPGTNTPIGENGEAVAVPGILRGTLTVQGDSQLWGADVNARWCWKNTCDSRSEVFAGYRHLNLRESLTFTENITVIGPGGNRVVITDPLGTRIVVRDSFTTRNQFHGGQIGANYERRWGRWSVDARGSVALGATHQVLEIDGIQTRQQPGGAAPMSFRGGLLAAGPNLGRFERDRFGVAPEFTLNVGYAVTPNLRVFAGYNFLYWSNVIRPGDQIDHVVDLTFVPNALPAGFSGQYRPRPLFKESGLAINGIQFGVDWRW